MVYSFNWTPQPKGNAKVTEAVATQYIKARYGTTPAEFARMLKKEQVTQKKSSATEITCSTVGKVVAS